MFIEPKYLTEDDRGSWATHPTHTSEQNIMAKITLEFAAFLNTPRPRQNGPYFVDDILEHIFLNKISRILIIISPWFVTKATLSSLVHVMGWRRTGDKPLTETMWTNWKDQAHMS